jgi:hypothetical protein
MAVDGGETRRLIMHPFTNSYPPQLADSSFDNTGCE